MSGSHNTSRLMVYFIGIFMIFAVFYEFWAIQHLGFVFKKANFSFSSWAVTLLKALAISFMVIMFFTYIANAKKLRIAYLILGSFFLISCAIQIPATGQLFRDYQAVNEFYTNNCPKELGDLDVKYVEDLGCPNKYYYRTANKRMDCEAETSVPSQCF
jgi:magnesium-transporting ATPase (P-type)